MCSLPTGRVLAWTLGIVLVAAVAAVIVYLRRPGVLQRAVTSGRQAPCRTPWAARRRVPRDRRRRRIRRGDPRADRREPDPALRRPADVRPAAPAGRGQPLRRSHRRG